MAETSSKGKAPATYKSDGPRRIVQEKKPKRQNLSFGGMFVIAPRSAHRLVDFNVKMRYATVRLW